MIVKQVSAGVQRFGVAVKDDGYGNLCLANMKTGNVSLQIPASQFKDLAYPGKYNAYARHCCAKNNGQGAGMFAYMTSARGLTFQPCWEHGVAGGVDEMLKTARPVTNLINVTTYGASSLYVPVNPMSPYDPRTGDYDIRPLGVSVLHNNWVEIGGYQTSLGSMICVFDNRPFMVAQLITLRTCNSQGVNEGFIESHCGVIGGGLLGMQWGHLWPQPHHDTGYIDQGLHMISGMATGIPTPPPDTTSEGVVSYGQWTYHKHTYNGETTYFCMRYVYMGDHFGGQYPSDQANSLMEPGLYCDASIGPTVVETVVAAARWD